MLTAWQEAPRASKKSLTNTPTSQSAACRSTQLLPKACLRQTGVSMVGLLRKEMTLPMRGQGRRQTSSCSFAEEVPSTQLMLPFLFLILALKETEARQIQRNILACCEVICTVQASATASDNLNEIINTRGLTLHVTGIRYCGGKKVMEGQTELSIWLQLGRQQTHIPAS